MSVRRSFRGAVEGPRPIGAVIMVAAASLTLDVTGQMAAWAVLGQILAIGWALTRREMPLQKNPMVLNAALAGIVALGAGMWVRGSLPVVALAHFATLAQALQLIDARPRKSEFVLVTLALFQVILASNLTDSVLFPPLLVVFLLTTVWTLMVHTLHAEALESNDPLAASRITTPGLLRSTLVASSLSILLAMALFLVLPRMRAAMLQGGGLGIQVATSGFSDRVELGELGRIRADSRAVMHVDTLAGDEVPAGLGYWRGLAFDHFDGKRWSVTPAERTRVAGSAELGIDFAPRLRDGQRERVQKIVREPVSAGVLFSNGVALGLIGNITGLEQDRNGGLYAPGLAEQRIIYTVTTPRSGPILEADDRASAPPGDTERHLQLPETSPWVAQLAQQITRGAQSDAERARRIEAWLLQEGRYSDTPPDVGDSAPVEAFLEGGLAGHCEYFASAMVVLLRSLDMPARMVNGFAGGYANRMGGFTTVTRADAHAWVEAHFARAGWVRFDPTPADLRASAAPAGLFARMSEAASAVELWWFRRVVDFDRSDQGRALRSGWLAWRRWRRDQEAPAPAAASSATSDDTSIIDPRAVGIALAGVALLLLATALRRTQRGPPILPEYARALRLLARRGLVREPAASARAFAQRVAEEIPQAASAFSALTESYLAIRFGGRDTSNADEELGQLRDSLRT